MMVKIIHEVLKTSNNPLHIITWSVLQCAVCHQLQIYIRGIPQKNKVFEMSAADTLNRAVKIAQTKVPPGRILEFYSESAEVI